MSLLYPRVKLREQKAPKTTLQDMLIANKLKQAGIKAFPIRSPTVPKGQEKREPVAATFVRFDNNNPE